MFAREFEMTRALTADPTTVAHLMNSCQGPRRGFVRRPLTPSRPCRVRLGHVDHQAVILICRTARTSSIANPSRPYHAPLTISGIRTARADCRLPVSFSSASVAWITIMVHSTTSYHATWMETELH